MRFIKIKSLFTKNLQALFINVKILYKIFAYSFEKVLMLFKIFVIL